MPHKHLGAVIGWALVIIGALTLGAVGLAAALVVLAAGAVR
ncbi:hypothetical protein [Glycomyces sp. NPDC048151]